MDVLFFLSFLNYFFICFPVGCTFICLWITKKLISLSCTWIICWFILRSFWGWQLYLLQITKLQNGLFQRYFCGHYFYLFLSWDFCGLSFSRDWICSVVHMRISQWCKCLCWVMALYIEVLTYGMCLSCWLNCQTCVSLLMSVVLFHCQPFESLAVCFSVWCFGVDHHQWLVLQCWPV